MHSDCAVSKQSNKEVDKKSLSTVDINKNMHLELLSVTGCKMQFLLVVVIILGHSLIVIGSRGIVTDKGQQYTYVFTYPQLMIAGSYVKACLTLYNFKLPVTLKVRFTRNRCFATTQTGCNNAFTITKAHQCIDLETPKFSNGMVFDALEIDIQGERRKVVKKGKRDAAIFSKREAIYVETDRTIYKPQDEIKIRLLALQFSLIPVETPMIVNVVLHGPDQVKVRQWPNVTIAAGVAEVTYTLQEHAQAGFWKLEVNGLVKARFEVKRYILERFKTTLEHPEHFFWGDITSILRLCSIYTFERPVQGIGTIQVIIQSAEGEEHSPITKKDKLINGCLEMQLHIKQLVSQYRVYHNIEIIGTVVEDGTNATASKSSSMTINSVPYDMANEPQKLKPGLPFSGHLHIRDKNELATEQNVTICYTHIESFKPFKVCKSLLVKTDDVIPFTIPPLMKVRNYVTVEAYIQNIEDNKHYSRPLMKLKPSYSITNNSLLIMPLSKHLWQCGENLTFNVMYTLNNINEEEIMFNYMLVSRFDIIQAGYKIVKPIRTDFDPTKFQNVIMSSDNQHKDNIHFDYFTIDMSLGSRVYTDVKFIVYFVTNGEVIADDMSLEVEKCLPNRVNVQWEKNEVEPNSKTRLRIASTKGSICAITATDIASSFMRTPNMLTPEDILAPFEVLDFQLLNSDETKCLIPEDHVPDANVVWFNGIHTDANSMFDDNKVGVISNLKLISRPCSYLVIDTERKYHSEVRNLWDEPEDAPRHGALGVHRLAKKDMSGSRIRMFFPQTWLWDALIISDNDTTYEVDVPSSVTRWVTNVLCLNSEGGVGLSKPTELMVRKPFFIELILPYSVKRKIEPVHMHVVIHNYFKYSIPVVITLHPNKFMRNMDGELTKIARCILPEGMITHTFTFTTLQAGALNISVTAEVVVNSVANCGKGEINNAIDIIYSSIRVEPEAYGEHVLKTALICAGDWGKPDEISWLLSVPEDRMIMNIEAGVTIDSNIFTPLVENIELWIREPAGTADEIISAVVSNFYAIRYFKANHIHNTPVVNVANENLHKGSEKLYSFFHNDGMFVVNGDSNSLSTIFKTAFVVRLLALIGSHVSIENAIIARAVAGLLLQQSSNGCFNVVSYDGTNIQTTSLTSFVMISLLEIGDDVSPQQKTLAKNCILRDKNLDTYSIAISTYALLLMGEEHHAMSNLNTLIATSERMGNLMYWRQNSSRWSEGGVDVEVAGYILMSLLHKSTPAFINYARLIVRWLLTNPQKGQYSTQDIVATLEGISRFSDVVNTESSNLRLIVSSDVNGETTFNLRPGAKRVKEVVNVYSVPAYVSIKVSGQGCVLVKSSVEFNTYSSGILLDTYARILDDCKCTIALTSCLTSNSTERSSITILKVMVPPGFAIDGTSLLSLDKQGMKKHESVDHMVLLYFTGVTRGKKCATFVIQETVEVQHRTNVTMKLYNYYAADAAMQHNYLLPSCKYPNAAGLTQA